MKLTKRISKLSPSPILKLDGAVRALKAAGTPVVNLTIGEPDFDTPEVIKRAGIQAIEENFTHYTPPAGIPELRNVIANKLRNENGISYSPEEVVVGVGSRQLLYNAFLVLCESGDEVLVHTPTWSSYVEEIKLSEATPVLVELTAPFKLRAKDLKAKITKKTKAILLNSPCNPTGAVIDLEELKAIASLAVDNNLWVISDEIYEKILYQGSHVSIASLGEQIKQRTITVNGLTKAYAMTGWRVGYAAGPKEVIDAMITLQGQTTSNTCSISQKAGLAAFGKDQTEMKYMVEQFTERRNFLVDKMKGIPALVPVEPDGAFYLFVSLEKILGAKFPTATYWCEQLLAQEKIAVVPGEAFLSPGYFRISFASSKMNLEKGIEGINRFIENNAEI